MRTERVCSASALSTACRTHHTAYEMNLTPWSGSNFLHGLEETLVADGDELTEIESVALVLLHVRDDETEIGGDEPLRCYSRRPSARGARVGALRRGLVMSGSFCMSWRY